MLSVVEFLSWSFVVAVAYSFHVPISAYKTQTHWNMCTCVGMSLTMSHIIHRQTLEQCATLFYLIRSIRRCDEQSHWLLLLIMFILCLRCLVDARHRVPFAVWRKQIDAYCLLCSVFNIRVCSLGVDLFLMSLLRSTWIHLFTNEKKKECRDTLERNQSRDTYTNTIQLNGSVVQLFEMRATRQMRKQQTMNN